MMITRALPLASLMLTAALATACGGSSDADGGGGAAGTGSTAGTGASGGTGGASGSGGSSGAGGAGGSCDAFKDATPGSEITVQYENTTSGTLYVLPKNFGCGQEVLFRIADSNQNEWILEPGDCGMTCELLQTTSGLCAAACQAPRILKLEPGSTYDYKWSGALYDAVDMPGECFFDKPSGTASCRQRVAAAAGAYDLTAEAASDCGGCTCDAATGNGFCNSFNQLSADTTAKGSISFPSDTSVKISFK
jgi:hypothetical protein